MEEGIVSIREEQARRIESLPLEKQEIYHQLARAEQVRVGWGGRTGKGIECGAQQLVGHIAVERERLGELRGACDRAEVELSQVSPLLNAFLDAGFTSERTQNEAQRLYRQLEKQLERLEREREELREEARSLDVDPAEARRRLLEKAKADTERMQDVNAALTELEATNRVAREVGHLGMH